MSINNNRTNPHQPVNSLSSLTIQSSGSNNTSSSILTSYNNSNNNNNNKNHGMNTTSTTSTTSLGGVVVVSNSSTQTSSPTPSSSSVVVSVSVIGEMSYWSRIFGFDRNNNKLKRLRSTMANGNSKRKQRKQYRSIVIKAGTSSIVHQIQFGCCTSTNSSSSSSSSSIPPNATTGGGGGGGSSTSNSIINNRYVQLAACCGPRIQLYGTNPQSIFHQKLAMWNHHNQKKKKKNQNNNNNRNIDDDDDSSRSSSDSSRSDNEDDDDDDDDDDDTITMNNNNKKKKKDPTNPKRSVVSASIVPSDRQLTTRGYISTCIDHRMGDGGRLLAVGTTAGRILIIDSNTRSTLITFDNNNNHHHHHHKGSDSTTGGSGVAAAMSSSTTNSSSTLLPIRCVKWFRDGQHILSAGDDGQLHIWTLNVTTSTSTSTTSTTGSSSEGGGGVGGNHRPVVTCIGHGDSIRSAALWQVPMIDIQKKKKKTTKLNNHNNTNNNSSNSRTSRMGSLCIIATGSYDHTIRIWNMDDLIVVDDDDEEEGTRRDGRRRRAAVGCYDDDGGDDRCMSVLGHGSPVEDVLFMSRTTMATTTTTTSSSCCCWLISAGNVTLKVWDIINGTCTYTIDTQHRKTITCLHVMMRRHHLYEQQQEQEQLLEQQKQQQSRQQRSSRYIRLLTGGLDGLIRIHSFNDITGHIQHLHGFKISPSDLYEENNNNNHEEDNNNSIVVVPGITSIASTFDSYRIAIGFTDGTIIVRQKGGSSTNNSRDGGSYTSQQQRIEKRKRYMQSEKNAGTYSFFTRGMNANATSYDTNTTTIVDGFGNDNNDNEENDNDDNNTNNNNRSSRKKMKKTKTKKLKKHDIALRRFQHSDALDLALAAASSSSSSLGKSNNGNGSTKSSIGNTTDVMSVLEELGKRPGGLYMALSNRNTEDTMKPLLEFIVKNMTVTRYVPILVGVINVLFDIYGTNHHHHHSLNGSGSGGVLQYAIATEGRWITTTRSKKETTEDNDNEDDNNNTNQGNDDDCYIRSQSINELYSKLRYAIQREMDVRKKILCLIGQIDTVMNQSSI